jgi:integrase/recombinase XerC
VLKTQSVFHFAMIEQLFRRAKVRRRMAANQLGLILQPFALQLHCWGYRPFWIQSCVRTVEQLGRWLQRPNIAAPEIRPAHLHQFLKDHLPQCRCSKPAAKSRHRCRAALGVFLEFLWERKLTTLPQNRRPERTAVARLMSAYDDHLSQVRALSVCTRRTRQHYARQFLKWRWGRQPVRLRRLRPNDALGLITRRARQLSSSGVHDLTVSLRSFLRFLEFAGRIRTELSGSVAAPAQKPSHPLLKILERPQLSTLVNSFPRATPTGRRD